MKKILMITMMLVLALLCVASLAEDHVCSGGAATCDARANCATCGKPYGRLADHNWGAWVSDGDATHTRTCRTNAGHTETRYHMGGASTCTQGAKCVYCGAVHEDPLGHIPTIYPGYAATCISAGATDGEKCSRCGDVLTARRVINAKGHSYNAWEPLPGGLHTAICTAAGCGEAGVVPCTPFTAVVGDAICSVCPICGVSGELVLPTLICRMDDALPMGQLLLRGQADCFGALYAFTLTGSYAGSVVDMDSTTNVTLPDNLSALPAFTLLRVDIADDGSQSLTAIDYRLADGLLTFTAEKAGLYLLMAAE